MMKVSDLVQVNMDGDIIGGNRVSSLLCNLVVNLHPDG